MQLKKIKDSSRPIFYKSFDCKEVKVDSASRKVSMYLACYGNIDSDQDMLVKGCAAKSITERGPQSNTARKIAFLWQHDMSEPIGKFTKLSEDEYGLYAEAEIDKIPQGDRALEQLKSGTLNQFSIGFQYVWDKIEYDEENECFIVKEINLFEGSVVTLGANENTYFVGMKSDQIESESNKLKRDTEKVLKGLPYETQIQIRQLISKHISLAENEPSETLKESVKPKTKSILSHLKFQLNETSS